MNARLALIAAGLAYGVWETVDIFWISFPAAAAVFAGLFLACTAWFWRRDSARAAAALALLCGFEAAVAPTLGAQTVTKISDLVLGLLPTRVAWLIEATSDTMGCAVSLIMLRCGWLMTCESWRLGSITIKNLIFPEWWLLAPLPVTFALQDPYVIGGLILHAR